jgi:hypothetical protein
LRLSDEYQNKKEIWIKCPKCGERFRPQTEDLTLRPSAKPGDSCPFPQRRKDVEDLLSRMDLGKLDRERREDVDFSLDAIPVIPDSPPRTRVYTAVTVFSVALVLVALGLIFHHSGAAEVQPPPDGTPPPLDYGQDMLLFDMMGLRGDILRLRHVDRTINYRGRESRIYKYFVSNLAPDLCQDITNLHLWSPRTAEGFKMVATCLDAKKEAATLVVNWDVGTATIKVAGRPLEVDLPLPRPGRAGGG